MNEWMKLNESPAQRKCQYKRPNIEEERKKTQLNWDGGSATIREAIQKVAMDFYLHVVVKHWLTKAQSNPLAAINPVSHHTSDKCWIVSFKQWSQKMSASIDQCHN